MTGKSDYPNKRDCEHGQLRRSCSICEAAADIRLLEDRVEALLEVHQAARQLMRYNGVDATRANAAYDRLSGAVHEVNLMLENEG